MISKPTLWGLLASVTVELERIDPRSPVAALARAYLIGEDLPGPIEAPASRKKRAYLDPGRAIRVADLHAEGMSTYQIATALGCSVTTAAKDLERQGIERDGRHFQPTDPQRIERLRQMRSEGKTLEEMGSADGVTRERVRQLCLKAGIDTDAKTRPLNEIERKAVAECLDGASLEHVAMSAGVHPGTLRNWIIRAGEKVRPSPKTTKRHPNLPEALGDESPWGDVVELPVEMRPARMISGGGGSEQSGRAGNGSQTIQTNNSLNQTGDQLASQAGQ
jgi:transposase